MPTIDANSESQVLTSLQMRAGALVALAHDSSDEARSSLVSELYEFCRAAAGLFEAERALALDIVTDIIALAPVAVRKRLAERVAGDPEAPHALVLALARDDIAVAFRVLLESPVLEDPDFVGILEDKPLEHQLSMLQRETVSPVVASATVETRDPQVVKWLVENPGAEIPRSIMETIVEAARGEPMLQRPLVDRADLPIDLAAKMQEFLPDELRTRLIAHHRLDAADQRETTASHPTIDAERLVAVLRAGKIADFEALFADLVGISRAAAKRLVASPTGEAMAVALKAHGVDRSTFATIFLLSRKARKHGALAPEKLARATAAYDCLSSEEAGERLASLQAAHPPQPKA